MKFDNKNWQISFSPQLAILWYSIVAGVLTAGLITIAVLNVESQERLYIDSVTQSSANAIKTLFEADIHKQLTSLNKLVNAAMTDSSISPLLAVPAQMSDQKWTEISQILDDTQSEYHAMVWVDSAFKVGKITSINSSQIVIDSALFTSALKSTEHSSAMKTAVKDSATMIIQLTSTDGTLDLVVYTPVFETAQSSKELAGFIGGVLLLDSYVKKIVPPYLLNEHQFALLIDEQKVYSDIPTDSSMTSTWAKQASFDIGGHKWRIDLAPKNEFLSQTHFHMIKILILLGALLSLFVAVAVYTAMFAANKTNIIKDHRKKTEQLLHNLPGMAYQALNKTDWPMILVSEGCEKLSGFTKLEFEQQKVLWGSIIHPDDYQRVRLAINAAAKLKRVFELEYRIKTKSNEMKLVWEKGESVSSTYNDEVIIEGFISDITSIKQVEADLIDSDAYSETIVNSVVEAVITIDQKGFVKSFNNAAKKMFGYSFNEIKDQAIATLMEKHHADSHDNYLAQYLKTNQAHSIGKGRELVAKRKDGTTFPIHLSVSEFQNNENRMFVGLIRDITQQLASEKQKRLHIEQLAHADRLNALGEMAAGIAHEINQPLTAISLYSQTAKNFCDSEQFEKLPAIFEKMSQHARRAGAVIESMQVMTRQGDRVKEAVSCQLLIDDVIKLAESEARLRDITIHAFVSNKLTSVSVDRVQIQQVILNLLRNGMEAMHAIAYKNGTRITIKAILNTENCVEIAISDTGCGISEEITKKLFTPFLSTKKNGTGIGLSISKRIIEEHGGYINFANNKPAGAVFSFTLPVHEQGVDNEKRNENTYDA